MKTQFPQTHAKECKIAVSNYESPALTAELQARMIAEVKHSKPLVTNPESLSASLVGAARSTAHSITNGFYLGDNAAAPS